MASRNRVVSVQFGTVGGFLVKKSGRRARDASREHRAAAGPLRWAAARYRSRDRGVSGHGLEGRNRSILTLSAISRLPFAVVHKPAQM